MTWARAVDGGRRAEAAQAGGEIMGACVPLWSDNGLIEGRRAHVGALIARPSRQCGVGMREGTPGESGGKCVRRRGVIDEGRGEETGKRGTKSGERERERDN